MPNTPGNFTVNTQLTTSAVAIATASASTVRTLDDPVVFTNSSTSQDATVTIYHVNSGGSANDSTLLIRTHPIPAGSRWVPYELMNKRLGAGQSIQALASVTGIINVSCGGTDYTAS